jgi:hypothetical protein
MTIPKWFLFFITVLYLPFVAYAFNANFNVNLALEKLILNSANSNSQIKVVTNSNNTLAEQNSLLIAYLQKCE